MYKNLNKIIQLLGGIFDQGDTWDPCGVVVSLRLSSFINFNSGGTSHVT